MSGYLDVKFLCKSSRSLTPWKSWKKQWCILRPCPILENCAIIAFHSSFGVCTNSSLQIAPGSLLCRTRSKSKQYAFGVFSPGEFQKPHIFLGGQSESDSQLWMTKIRTILDGGKPISVPISIEKSFKISFIDNNFTRKCNLLGVYGVMKVQTDGLVLAATDHKQGIRLQWHQLQFITMYQTNDDIDKGRICLIKTNREFNGGSGCIYLFCLAALELVNTVQEVTKDCPLVVRCKLTKSDRWLSKSEGYPSKSVDKKSPNKLNKNESSDSDTFAAFHTKGLDEQVMGLQQGPKEFDGNILITTESNFADEDFVLPSIDEVDFRPRVVNRLLEHRQSNESIGSGIYEEIADSVSASQEENLYESLQAYRSCSPPRRPPPPLPPRRTLRLDSTSDSGLDDDSWNSTPPYDSNSGRFFECGTVPRCHTLSHTKYTCDDKGDKIRNTFSVFRKRIKSDSRVVVRDQSAYTSDLLELEKSDILKTSTVPRKKRFDFNVTPSKSIDIMKHFRKGKSKSKTDVSKAVLKNDLARSCECLDRITDTVDKVIHHRCSKSVDNLDLRPDLPIPSEVVRRLDESVVTEEEEGQDLSMLYEEREMSDFNMRQDILQLIMNGARSGVEEDYLPMSPAGFLLTDVVEEHHYMVMTSPSPYPMVDKC